MLVSIVIPVYKREKLLRKCLDSVLAQTYRNYELILIDDGSPDDCGRVCDEYAANDARIQVYHKRNAGSVQARADGIEKASGFYTIFFDNDDYAESDYLESMLESVYTDAERRTQNAERISLPDVCYFGRTKDYLNLVNGRLMRSEKSSSVLADGYYSYNDIINRIYPIFLKQGSGSTLLSSTPWAKMWKTTLLKQCLPDIRLITKPLLGDDVVFSRLWYIRARSWYIDNGIVSYHWLVHGDQITKRTYDNLLLMKNNESQYLSDILSRCQDYEFAAQLNIYHIENLTDVISNYAKSVTNNSLKIAMQECRQLVEVFSLADNVDIHDIVSARRRIVAIIVRLKNPFILFLFEYCFSLIYRLNKVLKKVA
jgi:glycosyltransferase involved in cell wall biosynthesis